MSTRFRFILPLLLFSATLMISASIQKQPLTVMQDDAFFYFTIAGNLVERGILSFDGMTATNGFHPLWMGILAGLRYLIDDLSLYLLVSLFLSLILNSIAGILFLHFAYDRFSSPVTAVILLLLLRYLRDFSLMCMETSVLLPLLFAELVLLEKLDTKSEKADHAGLGVVIALAGLARLDSALMGVFVIFAAAEKGGRKMLLPLALPSVAAGISYLTMNQLLFGTWFSVSGSLKASGFGLNENFAAQLFSTELQRPWGLYLLMLGPALFCAFGRRISVSARVSGIFMVLFTIVQLFFSRWRLWYWYAYPAVLFLAFGVAPVVDRLYRLFSIPCRIEKTLSSAVLLITSIAAVYWGLSYARVPENDFRYRNMLIAEELSCTLPSDAVIAMGDRAGSFACFFNGHVIQAERLAGDHALASAVKEQYLEKHLIERGAEYLLSWTGPHGVEEYGSWEIFIPDRAQCAAFNNLLVVYEEHEVARWPEEDMSVFMWKLNEN